MSQTSLIKLVDKGVKVTYNSFNFET